MASELCMNCFSVKGQYEVCPYCGYAEGTPPVQPHYLTPGTVLNNHFTVGTVIGVGGFGIIYKCYDSTLGVMVAVKEFYPVGLVNRAPNQMEVGLLSGEKKDQYYHQLQRFLLEAQSIAKFGKAKDIVNVYDYFEENNTAYIIMEYIEGVLLKEYLEKNGKMEPKLAMSLMKPIITAVKKIHSEGIVHRDISPDNIFITSDENIKIFDFGAAQLNDSNDGKSSEKVIKVGYSAPEQYRDKTKQDFYTDVYSVGAIFYHMLTGNAPIESTEREYKDELRSPIELGYEIDANIDRAVMEALAIKPELRFQSVQQFEDALNNKRIAEYPQVKLKRRKRKRNLVISLSVLISLAVIIGIALLNTVFKSKNVVLDSVVDQDTITVWVDTEAEKTELDNVVNKVFKDDSSNELSDKMKNFMKGNKDISVNVEVKTASKNDFSGDGGPDMFMSDSVTDMNDIDTVSLKDNVYDALNMDDYLYMTDYKKYFPTYKEMPTSINSLLFFSYPENDNDEMYKKVENSDSIDMADIEASVGTLFSPSTIMKMVYFKNNSFYNKLKQKIEPDDAFVANFNKLYFNVQILSIVGKRENNIVSGVEARNCESLYTELTKDYSEYNLGLFQRIAINKGITVQETNPERKNTKDYSVSVVTTSNKMLISYGNCYAISAKSTENKQKACMRLLWILLSESAQAQKFDSTSATQFPIQKTAFNDFFTYNVKFKCFKNMVNQSYPCTILSNESATLKKFETNYNQYFGKQENIELDISSYCKAYAANSGEE